VGRTTTTPRRSVLWIRVTDVSACCGVFHSALSTFAASKLRVVRSLVSGACGEAISPPLRLGLRPGKCTSGGGLTTPAPARVVRKPANNRLDTQLIVNDRGETAPPRRVRLQCIFRTDAAGWPHRAAEAIWLHRDHPLTRPLLQPLTPLTVAPRCAVTAARAVAVLAGRGRWSEGARRDAPSQGAGKRPERFRAASSVHVIRVDLTRPPAHLRARHVSHTRIPYSPRQRAQREYERRAFSPSRSDGLGRPVPALRISGGEETARLCAHRRNTARGTAGTDTLQ
jgi:hypothetical protein